MGFPTCTVISDDIPSDPPLATHSKSRSEHNNYSSRDAKTKFPQSCFKACFGCAINENEADYSFTKNSSIKAICCLLPLVASVALWVVKFAHVYVILLLNIPFLIIVSACIFNAYKLHTRTRAASNRAGYYNDKFEDIFNTAKAHINQEKYQQNLASMLSRAIQIPTVSYDLPEDGGQEEGSIRSHNKNDDESKHPLLCMHLLLRELFPLLHRNFPPVVIHGYSLLYSIPGQDAHKPPIMLCAHIDVVPAPQNEIMSADKWINDPFSGEIIDDFIWGRGAIDNKNNVISQLAAIELLIEHKVTPPRTVFLALGHDEEIGGENGAAYIAKYFTGQPNFKPFEFILDEGSMIVKGGIPGFTSHIALISTSEKGYINVELSVSGPGGHSSMPPVKKEDSIVSILVDAIKKLEANPQPPHFEKNSGLRLTLQYLASEKTVLLPSFPFNVVFSNLWLFGTLVKQFMLKSSNAAAAMLRTTTAVCMIKGGTKLNILPYVVQAYVNHRIHPMDTIESVLEHDRKVINDPRVKIRLMGGFRRCPSPTSPHDNNAFQWIEECVHRIFDSPTTPSLLIVNTDTYHYWDLSPNIYRFSPLELTIEETKMFHGVNEKIAMESLAKMVLFYYTLIVRSS